MNGVLTVATNSARHSRMARAQWDRKAQAAPTGTQFTASYLPETTSTRLRGYKTHSHPLVLQPATAPNNYLWLSPNSRCLSLMDSSPRTPNRLKTSHLLHQHTWVICPQRRTQACHLEMPFHSKHHRHQLINFLHPNMRQIIRGYRLPRPPQSRCRPVQGYLCLLFKHPPAHVRP